MKFNIKNSKYQKILVEEEEKELEFLENFNRIKHKIKEKDIKDINNWDSYKKKSFFIPIKKKIKKKPVSIEDGLLKSVFFNLVEFSKNSVLIKNFGRFQKIDKLLNTFIKINIKKLDNIKQKTYFNKPKTIYLNIDLRKVKPFVVIKNCKKQIATLSNGLMFKKMNLNHKKYKKSAKITFLNVKTAFIKLNFLKNFNLAYIYIKGLNSISNPIIIYIKKILASNNNTTTNIVFINNHYRSNNKTFKFKKIKAIKRRLRKKLVKLK